MAPPFEQPTSWDATLPLELISQIFRFTVLEGLQAGSTSIHSSALLFGRVSKRWRDIAYSTPTLWTSISVNVYGSTPVLSLVSGIRAWILRARGLPLSVKLILQRAGSSGKVSPDQLALLTGTVLSFSTQIRHLVFKQVYDPVLVEIKAQESSNLGEDGFPILETLDLEYPWIDSTAILTQVLTPAPAIRLSRINCNDITPGTARSVLGCAPELGTCRLYFTSPAMIGPFASETITHHRLRNLHIGPLGFSEFFCELSLPALTHLTVDGTNLGKYRISTGRWPQAVFGAFLVRSQCALEQLSFFGIDLMPQDLEECIEIVSPTLKLLCIKGGLSGLVRAALLTRLTVPTVDQKSMGVLCPLLEYLEVHGGVLEKEGNGSGMLDMLESRFCHDPAGTNGTVKLRSAYVGGPFGPLQRKRAHKLKGEGLDLQLILEGYRFV